MFFLDIASESKSLLSTQYLFLNQAGMVPENGAGSIVFDAL